MMSTTDTENARWDGARGLNPQHNIALSERDWECFTELIQADPEPNGSRKKAARYKEWYIGELNAREVLGGVEA